MLQLFGFGFLLLGFLFRHLLLRRQELHQFFQQVGIGVVDLLLCPSVAVDESYLKIKLPTWLTREQ